jgi:NAD(P)-dependent dehydrogenase (short-subunit alcohol dehydrogenase family)
MIEADLRSEVVLVTGASSGLGRHFAAALARAGATLALGARRMAPLRIAADEISRQGGRALALRLDVTSDSSVEEAFAAIEKDHGPVTVLINNAGIAGPSRRAVDITPEEFAAVLETDLTGAFRVARRAARAMAAAGIAGSIVNIASILGERVTVGVAPYEAAKAGLLHLTRALALEWARHGIRVNALAPGYIETEINRAFFASEAGQAMRGRIPLRRLGQPEDLDGPLLLLASDASRYMTGSVITVDGGHLVSAL